MERIMRLSAYERAGLIAAAARNLGLGEAIVEKDLWVTYFLDYLFSRCPHKGEFEFKGGTSLSKCYGLIDRFSEDLDIVISAIPESSLANDCLSDVKQIVIMCL